MPEIFDINDWQEQQWLNTTGTRNKKIYLSPDGEEYFFKQSLKKGEKDYKYEFWSEVIASEIGKKCGLNILQYDIAYTGDIIGCISKSMLANDKEGLIEGGRLIQSFDTTFNPEERSLRYQYNFELICKALTAFKLEKYIVNIVELIVFDALIGNSDRHQENWAIIIEHSVMSMTIDIIDKEIITKESPWFMRFVGSFYKEKSSPSRLKPDMEIARVELSKQNRFAPIYDSGCSFARELTPEAVIIKLNDSTQLKSYVKKGTSEIHWEKEKVSHFELVDKLYQDPLLKSTIETLINRISESFNEDTLISILNKIDENLPVRFESFKIPKNRKELIIKLVTLRQQKLREIVT
jgi:hypothetical protein